MGPELLLAYIFKQPYATVVAATPLAFLLTPGPLTLIYYTFWFIVKTTLVVLLLSNMKALMARWRVDQIARNSWKWVIPFSLLMVAIVTLWPYLMDTLHLLGLM